MHPGKFLMIAGVFLTLIGAFLYFGGKIPFLGRLPGDIRIEKENVSFFFPLGTCLLISALLSLLAWLFRR
ncbi:MAG: DUF2905 domain-containing protein [Desulfuromonas sp.]|mgnify:CR=1 FL=1|nr:MAG: DUF2905 domain-containing protein [Desulfuromonas sp.]